MGERVPRDRSGRGCAQERASQATGRPKHEGGEAVADTSLLTAKQKRIYDFIRDKIEQRGYPPTVREIGEAFKIKSPNGVMCHLNALEKKGLINREKQAARAIQLADHVPPGTAELP